MKRLVVTAAAAILAFGVFVCGAGENSKSELKLAPVSNELLHQLGKKREPDWLRCPLFYTKDSNRKEFPRLQEKERVRRKVHKVEYSRIQKFKLTHKEIRKWNC